jgi:mono/diheme cytochrome c family protein
MGPRPILWLAAALLSACASPPAGASRPGVQALSGLEPAQQRGHDFAVRRCAGCHTVGLDDGGAGEGPAFRKLSMRYNAISLEHRFAEVSQHGFGRMPTITFTRSEAEDLVAYVDSLHAP